MFSHSFGKYTSLTRNEMDEIEEVVGKPPKYDRKHWLPQTFHFDVLRCDFFESHPTPESLKI